MAAAMATISRSSTTVTEVIGRLNTVPRQAHLIRFFWSRLLTTPTLLTPMRHYTCRSLPQYIDKLHRYAAWGAADAFRAGRRAGPIELLFRPAWRFFRMYVVQAGFLDGRHGLVLCGLQAWSVFLKWARVWEWDRFRRLGWPVELPAYDESPEIWRESP